MSVSVFDPVLNASGQPVGIETRLFGQRLLAILVHLSVLIEVKVAVGTTIGLEKERHKEAIFTLVHYTRCMVALKVILESSSPMFTTRECSLGSTSTHFPSLSNISRPLFSNGARMVEGST